MDTISEGGIHIKVIPDFETYGVSNWGEIYNLITERLLVQHENQYGDMSVGLRRGNEQFRRSVKILVADAFVPGKSDRFNTPVLLDGDKKNLRAENIIWRPRWLAWKYAHQFIEPQDYWFHNPVRDISTGAAYENLFHAAIMNGILCEDISLSIENDSRVWPTGQVFVYI